MKTPLVAAVLALGILTIATADAAPGGPDTTPGQARKTERTATERESKTRTGDAAAGERTAAEAREREREMNAGDEAREREREMAERGDGSETSQQMQERRTERKEIQEEYHEGRKAGEEDKAGKKPWWKFWGSDSES